MEERTVWLDAGRFRIVLTHLEDITVGTRIETHARALISGDWNEHVETVLEYVAQTATQLDAIAFEFGTAVATVGSVEDDFEMRFRRAGKDIVHVVCIPNVVEFDITQEQMMGFARAFREAFCETKHQ
ncbi:MAG: hypothetical protein ABUL73_00605 [Alphaproteobacteria bacterium]